LTVDKNALCLPGLQFRARQPTPTHEVMPQRKMDENTMIHTTKYLFDFTS